MNEEHQSGNDEPVYSRHVLDFLTVANKYCLSLEKSQQYTRYELFSFLQKIAPMIYLKAVLLPDTESSDEEATEHFVTEEEWETMFNELYRKFGENDSFSYVDLRENSHHDPIKASLAECFTDVYQDLRDFILLYQKPRKAHKENVVRECRKLFENRFGYRLLIAQAAIHNILYVSTDNIYEF